MVGSIWRYSHFLIAAVSALFLIVASVTGAILALEPVSKSLEPFNVVNLDEINLDETVKVLKANYSEVLELEITAENFVKASVVNSTGDSEIIYVNAQTGLKLGKVPFESAFFSFITNLHRSLFLKTVGRAFVGIISFLLCFIAVTGIFLLAQRQGGFKKWFNKVHETEFVQRYHVILGRWLLLPIIIIAATGVYLSAEKFSLLPDASVVPNSKGLSIMSGKEADNFSIFNKIRLSEVRQLVFPFSDDKEDYFELALTDRELLVHQYTGEIISEVPYPFVKLASQLSMQLHTGDGNVIWSIILFLASLSLLFFMFSGFAMSLKRIKKPKKIASQFTKDEAEYIILVGSETGNTYVFANKFYKALKKEGIKVYMSSLNDYSTYAKATQLVVFAATYGDGDAPSNANKFESLFKSIEPVNSMQFSVVGFGSLLYPHYCRFAVKVDEILNIHNSFQPLQTLFKINEQSITDFSEWLKTFSEKVGVDLKSSHSIQKMKINKTRLFEVIERTPLNVDNTALLRLRPRKNDTFQSGDLLNIIPPEENRVRQYSIARIDKDILLSVKWHPEGACSTYLCTLKIGQLIPARIQINTNFHFPKKASSVWLIANGTGIAPYLGMLNENNDIPVQLTWGGRGEESFSTYRDFVVEALLRKQISDYQVALSQVTEKSYVQDVLSKNSIDVAKTLKDGGVFMLCGSKEMQKSVINIMDEIAIRELKQPLSVFEKNGQVLIDCY